jgi:hypothetical protein
MSQAHNLRGFVRQVMSFIKEWDGRAKPTKTELQRIAQWWEESHSCCPEAVAMDVRFAYPSEVFSQHYIPAQIR